jgi:RHS repeat-associated protein
VSRKRYRYTGKEKDEESGLYYMLARYYSGWLGRWTAADPVGLVDGVNLYAYCRGNPVKYIDPDGKEIRLEGTEEEKKATFKNLQKLTNDELSMSFNKEDSTSTVIIKKTGGANTGKDLKLGSELIQELIQLGDGAKTVTIKQVKGEKKNYAYIADDSKEADAENGTGTNAIIDFNLASADVLVEDPDTGELFTETMAPHIVLAHELIHAYNINKGTRLPDKKVDHTYNTPYGRETENEKLGELNTVGVSGYDKNKYTENKIRAEQGQYTRRAYGWKDERLKGESLKNERLGAVLVRRIKGASEWIKKLF